MRVLLVEDDPITQQSIQMMLESEGMVVDTADLGEDGLEIGKLYDYDIIVLDVMLPDINGNVVCKTVRGNPLFCGMKIIIVSGVVNQEEIDQLLDVGADEFIQKPFDIEDVLAKIHALVEL